MTTTRKNKSLQFQQYDAEGNPLPQLSLSLVNPAIQIVSFDALRKALQEYEDAYVAYLKSLGEGLSFLELLEATFQEAVHPLFAEAILNSKAEALLGALTTYTQQAIATREGGFLGYGANEAEYNRSASWLKTVGAYVESKMAGMPVKGKVPGSMYLMTALKASPETFVSVKKDNKLRKIFYPIKKVAVPETNNINRASVCGDKIKKMERNRQSRWGITNFFVDIFTNEKEKLDRLRHRLPILQSLQKRVEQVEKAAKPEAAREQIRVLGRRLLNNDSTLSQDKLTDLHEAVNVLSSTQRYKNDVIEFIKALKKSIKGSISQPEAISELQVAFLSGLGSSNLDGLDSVIKKIVVKIKDKITSFQDTGPALDYINKLGSLEQLDKSLSVFIQDQKAQYQTLQTIENGWAQLLSDETKSMSAEDISSFIVTLQSGAIVDVHINSLRNKLVESKSKDLLTLLKSDMAFIARSDEVEMTEFAGRSLALEKLASIKARLNFVFSEDHELSYCKTLAGHRDLFSSSIIERLKQEMSVNELNTLLINVATVIPASLRRDDALSKPIKAHIEARLAKLPDASQALAYLKQLETMNKAALDSIDPTFHQFIQNKRHQYEAVVTLATSWADLLNDKTAGQMSETKINNLIAAVLWLDTPNTSMINDFIATLNSYAGNQEVLKSIVQQSLKTLNLSIKDDLLTLNSRGLSTEKQAALKSRLRFIGQANAGLTLGLCELRQEAISIIVTKLNTKMNVFKLKAYLTRLNEILPAALAQDVKLSVAILEAKKRLVKHYFSVATEKLHKEYEDELNFLKTGELGLWDKVKSVIKGGDALALTEENIKYWRHSFRSKYGETLTSQINATDQWKSGVDASESQALHAYLEELIAEDHRLIAVEATVDLKGLVDLRRKKALEKLDNIFGLEPGKPVDINLFMLRYFAIAEYQRYYNSDENYTLVQAGREFISEFHEAAQDQGGFVTELVAKLSLDALNQMYVTWKKDTKVEIVQSKNAGVHLAVDVVGRVAQGNNAQIQVPCYLLVNMVMQLVVKDIDDLLHGKNVNIDLLNDRIEFLIPKLEQQVLEESELNSNESGKILRELLSSTISALNPVNVALDYKHLVISQVPENDVHRDSYGRINDFSEFENRLLMRIKVSILGQIDTLSGVADKDLAIAKHESIIASLDEEIKYHQREVENLSEQDPDFQTKNEAILLALSKLVVEKDKQAKIVVLKKVRATYLHDLHDGFESAKKLFEEKGLTLRHFIDRINESFFEFLDPQLAKLCLAIKQNIKMAACLNEMSDKESGSDFNSTRSQLLDDLENKNKNILDIVRAIPENITRELPPQSADMVRQLQYRFADRFKGLMVKLLDENHLRTVDMAQAVSSPKQDMPVVTESSYSNFWGFFSGRDSAQASSEVKDVKHEPTAQKRIEHALKNIKSETVMRMLQQLSGTTDDVALPHLYSLVGKTAPVNIPRK